ncbi:MAG TPA: single-stranded DNA-binding protein, partial [Nitrosopumilaceae archaeon]|nr:single-stranded DNA-binding protein [Nitrosopumilaceae archaeon]
MSTIRNKVILIGNLGSDPEIKSLENDKKYARISLATHEAYKNQQGERVTDTTWHTLIAWGKLAEVSERFLKKGVEICAEGKIVNNNW